MENTFDQQIAFRYQDQHLAVWKGKLNEQCYNALENWVKECNAAIRPTTEPYCIVRGEDLTRFILNWKP